MAFLNKYHSKLLLSTTIGVSALIAGYTFREKLQDIAYNLTTAILTDYDYETYSEQSCDDVAEPGSTIDIDLSWSNARPAPINIDSGSSDAGSSDAESTSSTPEIKETVSEHNQETQLLPTRHEASTPACQPQEEIKLDCSKVLNDAGKCDGSDTSPLPDTDTEYSSDDDSCDDVSDDGDEDEFDSFRPVMDVLDLQALATSALNRRKNIFGCPSGVTCKIEEEARCGSYNLVYKIVFSDGVKWAARIPGDGHILKQLDVDKMASQYSTMSYIRQKTSIPMPDVLHWTANTSEIGSAYALLTYIEGTSVSSVWFDQGWTTEEKRLKVLENLAKSMRMLFDLRFDMIGMLQFDDKGIPTQVGPDITHHTGSYLDNPAPWACTSSDGPYTTLHAWLRSSIDQQDLDDHTQRGESERPIQRMLLDCIPAYLANAPLCLAHADLDWQNILINPVTCEIAGIIDWDNVGVKPASMGCTSYPRWIMRDWNPGNYDFEESEDHTNEEDQHHENTTAQLSKYRKHYTGIWQTLCEDSKDYDSRYTKLSHILEAIRVCRVDNISCQYIVIMLLHHSFENDLDFDLFHYANAWMEDNTAPLDAKIKIKFENMWHAEWESGSDASSDGPDKHWYTECYREFQEDYDEETIRERDEYFKLQNQKKDEKDLIDGHRQDNDIPDNLITGIVVNDIAPHTSAVSSLTDSNSGKCDILSSRSWKQLKSYPTIKKVLYSSKGLVRTF